MDEKSNEITAIPKLLKMLEITGAIVTIDAMGCQKEIARTIRERKAHYVLALKANHEHLYEQVVAFWDRACARQLKGDDIRYHREWSEGHGRTECRRCWATSDLSWLEGREEWKDLKSVVMIEAERFVGDAVFVETRYYLSSLSNDAEVLNEAVRSHWGVENSLHWVLDVTFHEDSSRIKKENAPENFGLLRRLALCLLKKESTSKRSIKGKRLRASWDDGYLLRVLCGNVENREPQAPGPSPGNAAPLDQAVTAAVEGDQVCEAESDGPRPLAPATNCRGGSRPTVTRRARTGPSVSRWCAPGTWLRDRPGPWSKTWSQPRRRLSG